MGKWIRYMAMAAALSVFLFSIAAVGKTLYRYYRDGQDYREAEEKFTRIPGEEEAAWEEGKGAKEQGGEMPPEAGADFGETKNPPLVVDFEALRQVNGDVVGWLYCEDTPISYPVVRGEDNGFYLSHGYDKKQNRSGAIFVDAACSAGFADANTILYGHHMKDGSMFACLADWREQSFYEAHPQMWLLTPEENYRVVLFAGYTTPADSETYTIFTGFDTELEEYLAACLEKSDFQAGRDPLAEPGEGYVVLSTCEYSFQNARYVLHGRLVPAGK